jgi:threonine dehydrogenase-like Zn-dependent dehydrogenase
VEEHPTAWAEQLYREVREGRAQAPWDRGSAHPLLIEWARERALDGNGRRALVVGSGLGADAELVAGLGFDTVAFDISPTAVELTRERYPDSGVEYVAADLLDPPEAWRGAFDFVFESLTVQSMPRSVRRLAVDGICAMVAPGGTLLVIATALGQGESPDEGPPWQLTREELDLYAHRGLKQVRIEDIADLQDPARHRWRAEFRR